MNIKLIPYIVIVTVMLCNIKFISAEARIDCNDSIQFINSIFKVHPFPLSNVKITDGPFYHAQEMNKKWLKSLEPDRLLSGFLTEAGLKTEVPRYGGWESSGVSGHILGHYLSACAMMYASTGDKQLLEKINYCIDVLDKCQKYEDTGLIAGFEGSRKVFNEIKKGQIYSNGFDLNGSWVPFYTLHKEFAGLIDVCNYCPNKIADKAKVVLIRFAEWLYDLVYDLSDEQMHLILKCEHGGITESLSDIYSITGDRKYLLLAMKFDHHQILRPLLAKCDSLPGKHANTTIPKIVGAIREYELSGKEEYKRIAEFFWDRVVNHHSYVIGGNSEYEHFGAPDMLASRLSDSNCETCNTYNMLKLTEHLFSIEPKSCYVDYYERALYNQILASQNPQDGMVCYMSPMGSGFKKNFSLPYESFWCCVGSGIENHSKYGKFIYFTSGIDNLFVNMFIPSELNWDSRNVKIIQSTNFPYSDESVFTFEMTSPQIFTFNIRYPYWSKGCSVTVNGTNINHNFKKGEYISIARKWMPGDKVCITFSPEITSEPILGDESQRAYLFGPIVLASIIGDDEDIPVIITDNYSCPDSLIAMDNRSKLIFKTLSSYPIQKELIPYFKIGGNRMVIYYNHFKSKIWEKQLQEFRMRTNKDEWLRKYTVSRFTLGEMQPEREHNFKSENSQPSEWQGRKYRESNGGFLSFEMEVDPKVSNTLYCTYWGNRFENHSFDIEINGVKIGFENIHNWGERYVERKYNIPYKLTEGRTKVLVTLRAIRKDAIAGPIFECRVMRDTF